MRIFTDVIILFIIIYAWIKICAYNIQIYGTIKSPLVGMIVIYGTYHICTKVSKFLTWNFNEENSKIPIND